MGALPIPEPIGLRYAPYIQELRELFAFSGLQYGSPDDVFAVIERIQNSPAFVEDLTSLVRAAILREGGAMPHGQLLEILAVAIGGTGMEHAPQTHRQPLRQLLSFVAGVLRRPWNLPPGERSEVLSFPSEPQLPETETPAAALVADAPPVTETPAAAFVADAPPAAEPPPAILPETQSPAPLIPAAPSQIVEATPVAEIPPGLAPLAAMAFAHPKQPQPVPRPILREAFALKPVLATELKPVLASDLPPAPPKPKPLPPPPTLEVRLEAPVDSQPDPEPAPLPMAARSFEPVPQPATHAAPPPTSYAEQQYEASAPWVAWNRPPKPRQMKTEQADSQTKNTDTPVQKTSDSLVDLPAPAPIVLPAALEAWRKRIPRLSRSMHEVLTVGATAAVIAILVAVALRPGSSLQSEALQPPSPDWNTAPGSSPRAATAAPVAQAVAEPAKPSAFGPALAIPATAARKSHGGGGDQEYIAAPTAHYYNGWGPAGQTSVSQPASGSGPSVAAASANPAAASATPSSAPAPIERHPEGSFRSHYEDIDGQHYFAVPPSVMADNLVSAPKPDYPLLARIAHVEGKVVVEGVIDRDGSVSSTRVVSGHRLLRGAAVSALRRRRYRPYRVDGRPVDVATTFAVNVEPRK